MESAHLFTPAEFIKLDRRESLQLLASLPVGRLILTVGALATVRPMNFVLIDELIVLRTAAHTTVSRHVDRAIVAFEVDELDATTSSGWSVTVNGRATLVADPVDIARYQATPLTPWAPGEREQFVTISTELVEGRRIVRSPIWAEDLDTFRHSCRQPSRTRSRT